MITCLSYSFVLRSQLNASQTSRKLHSARADRWRAVLDDVQSNLKFADKSGWYMLDRVAIRLNGGAPVLRAFNGSIYKMLTAVYPEHAWIPWKFRSAPKSLWNLPTQRSFWLWLADQKGYDTFEQWYALNVRTVQEHGGGRLLELFHNSLPEAVASAFPEHAWERRRFDYTELNYWVSRDRQKELFVRVMQQMNLRDMDSWYSVTQSAVLSVDKTARIVLDLYGGSLSTALEVVFPDHAWQPWKFKKVRHGFWDSIDISSATFREYFLQYLGRDTFQVEVFDDWYRISARQLRLASAHDVVAKFGGMFNILSTLVPDHRWDAQKFSCVSKKSSQRLLRSQLGALFPNCEIVEELLPATKSRSTLHKRSNFDVALPSLGLVFEYQGAHHYDDILKYGDRRQKSASEFSKAAFCERSGFSLIQIPYWWDGSCDSLANTIRVHRPELFPSPLGMGRPIRADSATIK